MNEIEILKSAISAIDDLAVCRKYAEGLKAENANLLAACKFAKAQIKKGAHKKALPILAAAIAKAKPPDSYVPNTQPPHTNIGQGARQ